MDEERNPAGSPRLLSLAEKFRNKAYRDSYVVSHTRRFLARQMRKFRGDQSQAEFGEILGKQQTVVSRLEDASYGKWTLQTLFEVAAKLDVAVIVRFVDFSTFMKLTNNMSDEATRPAAYHEAAESFSSVRVNTQPAVTNVCDAYALLPSNLPTNEFRFIRIPAVSEQLNKQTVLNLGRQEWQHGRTAQTTDLRLRSVGLIEKFVNPARQQNPIADTQSIGVH